MKGFFKLTTAAFALVAFASCSNDDFLASSDGTAQEQQGIKVQVESLIDATTTRSAYIPEDNKDTQKWQDGDKIWVLDETMLRYDKYAFKASSSAFILDPEVYDGDVHAETANLKEGQPKYALFSHDGEGNFGWDFKSNNTSAKFTIDDEYKWEEVEIGADKTKAYLSNMPMWGEAASDATYGVNVNLFYTTAVLRIDLQNVPGNAKYIVVDAYQDQAATKKAWIAGQFVADIVKNGELDKETILALPATTAGKNDAEMVGLGYSNVIKVNVSDATREKSYIYLPLIVQDYGLLRIGYTNSGEPTDMNTTGVTVLKAFVKSQLSSLVKRANPIRVQSIEPFATGGATPKAVSAALALQAEKTAIDVAAIQITTLATDDQTITIPATNAETINLSLAGIKAGEGADLNKLIIKDAGTFVGTLTIDVAANDGITEIELDVPTAEVVLTGKMGNTTAITGKAKGLTIGKDIEKQDPTKTIVGDITPGPETGDITIQRNAEAGNITLANFTSTDKITINGAVSGEVKARVKDMYNKDKAVEFVVGQYGSAGKVSNDGGDVTVKGTVGNITTKGNVTVERESEGVAISGLLFFNQAKPILNLTCGYIAKLGGGSHFQELTINNTEKGQTAIKELAYGITEEKIKDYTSTWAGKKMDSEHFGEYATGDIFTATQLQAYPATTAGKLYANMALGAKDFAPLANLTAEFDGNSKEITGLTIAHQAENHDTYAGLFKSLGTGSSVENLTIKTVATKLTASGSNPAYLHTAVGTLAGNATGDNINITNVQVSGGSLTSEGKVVGGLIGEVAGNVTITGSAIANKQDYSTVELASITGQNYLGGIVGKVTSGKAVIKYYKANLTTGFTATQEYDKRASSPDFGTVGLFIGNIAEGLEENQIGEDADDKGYKASTFKIANRKTLGFNKHYIKNGDEAEFNFYGINYVGFCGAGAKVTIGGTEYTAASPVTTSTANNSFAKVESIPNTNQEINIWIADGAADYK